jgi:DNA-binding SARP family transcriptional activator/predicted ATPase
MKKLQIKALGGLAVTAVTDPATAVPLHFRTDKIRALLIYLALEGERPHERQALAALLWPEMPEQTALKNLRQSLHRLQQTVNDQLPGLSDALLTVTRGAVQLHPAYLELDALQFQALLAACEKHRHRHLHLCDDCLTRLNEAATLYQGELLAGFSLPDTAVFEEWLLFWRERLQQQAASAFGQLAVALSERGDVEPALAYARRQLALDPFREEAYRLLMALLAHSGRHGQALAQYESCRRLLRDELGVEPAAETTALYHKIQAEQRGETAADNGRPAICHHFPAQFTPFIGREQELRQIEEMFLDPDCRLLTLVGPGGIGKSRLSLRAGELLAAKSGLADDIYFFPLAAATTAEALLTNLLHGLGATAAVGSAPQESLLDYLRGRRCLLILDNFEQLLENGPLLTAMLTAAPGLRLLVTSQQALNIQAERRLTLGGLDYPAAEEAVGDAGRYSAIHLFVEAARQVDPAFRLNGGNETAVVQICRLVQGVPLALELAAAWARVMDCAAIVREISRSLDFLSLAPQDKPGRHQSMTAVFAYAWQLLPESERTVLGQLAVFRGPFSLEAAITVAEATPLALARLLDRSLVQRRQGGQTDGHYELHELLRQFVQGQTADRHQATARRHSDYYLALVAAQEKAFYGPQPRQAVAAIQPYLDNIRQAWRWAVEQRYESAIARSLEGIGRFYQTALLLAEGFAMFSEAISGLGETSRLLIWRAYFLEKQGEHNAAIQQARQALSAAGENRGERAAAHSLLGKCLPHAGQFDAARAYQEQAIAYYQETADLERLALAWRRMAILCWRKGEHDQALHYFQQAIPPHQALGHQAGLAQLYSSMGGVYWARQELAQALRCIQQAGEIYEALDDRLGLAVVMGNMAILYEADGQYEQALFANQRSLAISQESGARFDAAMDWGNRGRVFCIIGEFEQSLDCYYRALEIGKSLANQWVVAYCQNGMAAVYRAKGDWATAGRYYDLALPALLAQGSPIFALDPLLGKGELLYDQGDWPGARGLAEEALALALKADLPDRAWRSRLLLAKLDAATGAGDGRALLLALLAETADEMAQAALHYELWRLTGEREEGETAVALYQRVVERTPAYAHKRRLAELQKELAGSSS